MNARDFTPITHPLPLAHPPVTQMLAAHLVLEPARVSPCYAGMDDTGDWAMAQAEKFAEVQAVEKAQTLEEVQHEMRVEWKHALNNMHALSTPKLPTVDGGKVVMVPVTELVGTLMETNHAVGLLCDALRTGDMTALHVHLRQIWLDGYSEELAQLEWTA